MRRDGAPFEALLTFYDAEGREVNRADLVCNAEKGMILELGEFLESCGYEGGLRHGQLRIEHTAGLISALRYHTRDRASFASETAHASYGQPYMMPITLRYPWRNILGISNCSDEEISLRVRCLVGNRKPEELLTLGARASRLLSVEDVFPDLSPESEGAQMRAYLRVSVRGEGECSLQCFEWCEGKDANLLSAVQ